MKTILTYLGVFMLVGYLIGIFANANFNPFEWPQDYRYKTAGWTAFIWIFFLMFYGIIKISKD